MGDNPFDALSDLEKEALRLFLVSSDQKELARRALEWIRKNPKAGIISISQNDQIGFCECEKCKAIDAAKGIMDLFNRKPKDPAQQK